ncbi:MAG: CHASE domain-containing protein [Acidobacteriota bacterium]
MQTTEPSSFIKLTRFTSWFSYGKYLPWIVFLAFSAATLFLWDVSDRSVKEDMQTSFDIRVRETLQRIQQRMRTYEEVLRGAQGLFAASDHVTRAEFRQYYQSLLLEHQYPGIQGLGFAMIVKPNDLDRHIQTVRREIDPSYTITPKGARDVYSSIIYLEPFSDRNLRAFGYDMFSEPVRHKAMALAVDSARPAISGKVTLVQETNQGVQAGFLMYLPVYKTKNVTPFPAARRAELLGWVYSPFRMNDLMSGLFSEQAGDADMAIYDNRAVSDTSLMFISDKHKPGQVPRFRSENWVEIAGHHWTVIITSTPQFEAGFDTNRPILVAGISFGASILLSLMTMMLVNSRARAFDALRVESRYKNLMLQANDSILVIDMNRRITDANQQACDHYGYGLDELRGKSIEELHPPESRDAVIAQFESLRQTGSARFEELNRKKDGTLVPAEISERIVRMGEEDEQEEYVLKFVRDISERKRAEHEREELVKELQEALADIKTLSGLIPICSSCKKIRDDRGYWNVLESYLAQHSEAQFTHGICPDCMKKLYPEFAAKLENGQEG